MKEPAPADRRPAVPRQGGALAFYAIKRGLGALLTLKTLDGFFATKKRLGAQEGFRGFALVFLKYSFLSFECI